CAPSALDRGPAPWAARPACTIATAATTTVASSIAPNPAVAFVLNPGFQRMMVSATRDASRRPNCREPTVRLAAANQESLPTAGNISRYGIDASRGRVSVAE